MQQFQDTITGQEWHFDDGVDITALPSAPKTLSATIIPRPSEAHDWVAGAWVADIAKAQAAKLAQLAADYAAAVQQPVTYMGAAFQADDASQVVLTKVLVAGTVPAGFYWLDASNTPVPMTYPQLQGLAAAMLMQGQAAFAKLQTLKSQVRAAATADQVLAVVW